MTDAERMCEAAIAYAELGYPVVPIWWTEDGHCGCGDPKCNSQGKHPLTKHGLLEATADVAQIRKWWKRWPKVNIAIRTGRESGDLVIDIDPQHGGDRDALGDLPETATVATGGGGQHLHFKMPKTDVRSFKADQTPRLGLGIDVRANGGYAIVPPSRHVSGAEYKWTRDVRGGLADLPQHILEKLIEKPTATKTAAPVTGVIPEGRRNDTLTSFAGTMRRRGMSEEAILAALRVENRRCEEPLRDAELGTIARSIGKKAPAETGVEAPRPVYVRMADITAKPVQWLWRDRLPIAMLSLLIGVEGKGKTFVALDMAARITSGRPWPDAQTEHDFPSIGNVVFLTSEDHLEYTIRPRLDAAKADSSRVFALKGVKSSEGDEFFDITQHLPALEAMVKQINDVHLVIVDPLTAFLGTTDQHKNGEVRVALSRFSALAEKYGCAVVGISHLSKDTSRQAIHRTIGSVAFSAAARAVWLVSEDKEDQERRLFVPVKNNLSL